MSTLATNKTLWKNGLFVRLWCGSLLSAMADTAFFLLLPWFIIHTTGSEAILGTALICMSIPRLLFMLAGGVAADRFSRKWIMFTSMLARALILLGFSFLLLNEGNNLLPISAFVMATLFGIVDAFFWPARSSIVPTLVSRAQLAQANSMMEIAHQISMVGGPLIIALLIRTMSYPVIFMLLATSFFIGTFFILSLRIKPVEKEADPLPASTDKPVTNNYLKDILTGIRYTYSIPILMILFILTLFINMLYSGPVQMGIPLFVKELGWDGSAFSSLSTSLGIGTIIGGLLTAYFKGFRGKYMLLPFFLGTMGVAMSSYYFIQELSFGLLAHFIIGVALSMVNIPMSTYIQTIVPTNMLGRVMSLLALMSIGFGPVSYAICSFLLAKNIATPGLLLLGGGIIFASISISLLFFRAFRQMEQHPSWKKPAEEEQQQLSATLSS